MVSVVIQNSYTVVPAEPTPNGPLSLSEFDQRQAWTLAKTLYVYKPNSQLHDHAIDTLRASLSRALVPFYPLAGRVRWVAGGRLEIDCNALGAEFVVAESDSEIEQFGDFSPGPQINDLLPAIDYNRPIEDLPMVTVRVTKFACGGLTVGLGLSHTAADGVSALNFVSSWSKLARGEQLADDDMPLHDRKFFFQEATPKPIFDHIEFKPTPLLIGHSDCDEERAKESTVAMLKLTKAQVNQLRKMANVESLDRPYSRFESITAHIWRCACKAREFSDMQPTVVRVPVDCRDRLKPPCPRRYFGNTIMATITDPTSCFAGELVSKPLGFAAEKLRKAIGKYTKEYIWSALIFLKSLEDINVVRSSFHIEGSKAGQFMGNPNLAVTSWINLPIYEADFGWGKPVYMGPGTLVSDGKCFIVPSCEEDGSLVLALRLQTAHMDAFKKLLYEKLT